MAGTVAGEPGSNCATRPSRMRQRRHLEPRTAACADSAVAVGIAHGNTPQTGVIDRTVRGPEGGPGLLVIGPRDGNHSCDLAWMRNPAIRGIGEDSRQWVLARDVTPDILAGNPHADGAGRRAVRALLHGAGCGDRPGFVIPPGSGPGPHGETDPARRGRAAGAGRDAS